MNFASNANFLTWKKSNYSEFYFATLISYLIINLIRAQIIDLSNWLINAIQTLFQYTPQSGQGWYSLIFVCFSINILIQIFVIQHLGIKIDQNSTTDWGKFAAFAVIFGFFIFIVNQIFGEIPMPAGTWTFVINILGGNSGGFKPTSEVNFWKIIPWFWTFAPILLFYIPSFKPKS